MLKGEQDILIKLKAGNQYGLKDLFELYHQGLCVFALKYVDEFQEAEDIVQETFVQFWEKKHYQSVSSSIKSYLYMTVQNKCLRRLEKQKKVRFENVEHFADQLINEDWDTDVLEERKRKLLIELDKLPPKGREVLEHIVFRGLKYKEVAEELDISINTVKTQFSRSLKQLRSSIDTIIILMW